MRLACPRCGDTRLSTVERLTAVGRCRAITIDAHHHPQFHWTGWTDVEWDSSTTIGVQDAGGEGEGDRQRFADGRG